MGAREAFNRIKHSYIQFVEKQGFAIIAVICVAVITATALWTEKKEAYISPTPPVSQDVSAAQLMQQSLHDAATPSPAPTQTPRPWTPPLDEVSILRPFDAESMVQSGTTEIWSIHDAVDLTAGYGSQVYAMADGTVTSTGNDRLQGIWLLINHGDGIEALYSGLALKAAYIAGDKVFAGDVIGYTGSGPLDETDLNSHLHLRVTREGRPIDPLQLWNSPEQIVP